MRRSRVASAKSESKVSAERLVWGLDMERDTDLLVTEWCVPSLETQSLVDLYFWRDLVSTHDNPFKNRPD